MHGLQVKNTRATGRERNGQKEGSNTDFPHGAISDSSWTSESSHLAYNEVNVSLRSPT